MPESNKNILDYIKSKIIGTNLKFDERLDKVLDRVTSVSDSKNNLNYAEMLRKYFNDAFQSSNFLSKGFLANTFQNQITAERCERYANCEEIVDSIPYFARALKVIADEVVSPDDLTKKSISIIQEESESTYSRTALDNTKKIIDVLEIDDYIHNIVYECLKLGDQFIEICNFKEQDIPLTQTILKEEDDGGIDDLTEMVTGGNGSSYRQQRKNRRPYDGNGGTNAFMDAGDITEFEIVWDPAREALESNPFLMENFQSLSPNWDPVKFNLNFQIVYESETMENVDISDVRLIIHDPRYVIKLQSNRFKMCLGYLVLPRFNFSAGMGSRVNQHMMSDYRDLMGIDKLYSEIVKRLKTQVVKGDIDINKKEVMAMLSRVIKEIDDVQRNDFKIRFVPAEKMEHFYLNNKRFFPYGESIFYKSTFTAKLLIALETAVVIKRISDSVDTRAFYIETGTPRDVRTILDQVREARTKRKISLDKFGSIGSIPSMITSYEDYYIPQTNGKRFIEFESIPPTNSIRDITEELKFFRDMAISSLEVPPALLSLEENINSKATLSQEVLLFARTVVAYQSNFSTHLNRLIEKIYRYVYKENFPKSITVTFSPPKFLQLEKDLEYNRLVSEMITMLTELGIDKEFLKKKYLTFDWNKLKEFENQKKIEEKMKPSDSEEEQMFSGGGGGGFKL